MPRAVFFATNKWVNIYIEFGFIPHDLSHLQTKKQQSVSKLVTVIRLQSKSLLVWWPFVWPEFGRFAQSSYLVYFVLGILYYSVWFYTIHTCSPVRRYRIRRRGRRFGYTWSPRWTSRCSPLARTHSRYSVRTPASLHSTARQ